MSEEEQIIRVENVGIKCDAPGCDYRDGTASIRDYDQWLNRPCPKCGANLLTEADLDAARRLIAGVTAINEMAALLTGKEKPERALSNEGWRARIRFRTDGSGNVESELVGIAKATGTED